MRVRGEERRRSGANGDPRARVAPSRGILVLGMHRSGTSALTGALSRLGANAGSNLMDADPNNPRGYWEHKEVVEAHRRVLSLLGSAWSDERPLPERWWERPALHEPRETLRKLVREELACAPLWTVKDPRMMRLLPLWEDILRDEDAQPQLIFIVRHPAEVSRSLASRDDIRPERACLLWSRYLLEAEAQSRHLPRALLSYEGLMADWREELRRADEVLGLGLPIDGPEARQVDDFLDGALRHHARPKSEPGSGLVASADGLYACMQQAAPHFPTPAALAPFAEELDRTTTLIRPWLEEAHELRVRMIHQADLEHRLERTEQQLSRLHRSLSWRITRPLRYIRRRIGSEDESD